MKKGFIFLFLGLFLNVQVAANEPQIIQSFWMAFQSGNKNLTNMDVEDYICVTNLSDEMMISLFREAEGDYNRYQILRRKWAQDRFKDGLRQYAYIYALQKMATSKLWHKEGRPAFTTNEKQFREEIKIIEDASFGEWYKQPHLGIKEGYEGFGQRLKDMGYPHKPGISNTDLSLEWRELQIKRIKEKLRLQEARKYEYVMALFATGNRDKFHVRPIEASDFRREVEAKINELNGSRTSAAGLTKALEADPRLGVLIKNAEFLGPDNVTLGKLKSEAPSVFNEYKSTIENNLYPALEKDLVADIQRYEGISAQLAQKYNSPEKLHELADEMKKEFLLGSGDFNHFMMARLYTMAAIKVEQGSDFKGNTDQFNQAKGEYLAALMQETKNIAQAALNEPQALGTTRLEDHFIQMINENPVAIESKELLSSDEYLKQYKAMVHWVVKFQFKKAALEIVPMLSLEQFDSSTYEPYQKVQDYLVQQQFVEGVDRFRRVTARRRVPYMRIDYSPEFGQGEPQDPWDFVLEKFPQINR